MPAAARAVTTAMLLERLPRGHVVAVDQSASMVAHAREALGDRATVFQAELTDLALEKPVDAVFSNAVFHWIARSRRASSPACTPHCDRAAGWSRSAGVRATSPASSPPPRRCPRTRRTPNT